MALCLCECVCSCLRAMCFATEGPWIQPEASLFSVFAHWLNWLMKCSVIQSGEKILTTTMKHNHRGLHWRECVWERCKLKVIILVQSPASTSSVYVAKISLCVCVFMAFCLHDSRVSVNQSTLILYTSSPDGCPQLLVDTVYSCFPSAYSSHREQEAQRCLH